MTGPVRPPRRNERHPSLVRVDTVNGPDAEPPEERPRVRGPDAGLRRAPGRAGPIAPCLRQGLARGRRRPSRRRGDVASARGGQGPARPPFRVEVIVVLAGVRPEEVSRLERAGLARDRWKLRRLVRGAGAGRRARRRSGQSAGRARRRRRGGRRRADALAAGVRRRVFGAGRATSEGGGRSRSSPPPARIGEAAPAGRPRRSCSRAAAAWPPRARRCAPTASRNCGATRRPVGPRWPRARRVVAASQRKARERSG